MIMWLNVNKITKFETSPIFTVHMPTMYDGHLQEATLSHSVVIPNI